MKLSPTVHALVYGAMKADLKTSQLVEFLIETGARMSEVGHPEDGRVWQDRAREIIDASDRVAAAKKQAEDDGA